MRSLGHIRDDERPAGLVHHEHLVGGVFEPEAVTLPARIDDQVGQDCTGSIGLNVETWCEARSIPCDRVSRRFTYTLGRQLANPRGPIIDVGARPSAVVDGARNVGVVAESTWPSGDLAVINEPADFFTIESAIRFRVKDIAVIEEDGRARVAAIRRALAAQYPVAFGLYVDDAFEGWRGEEVYTGRGGGGGHCVRAIGYAPGKVLIANSWGTAWGFGGFCWMSEAFIGSQHCFDFYLTSAAPAVHE